MHHLLTQTSYLLIWLVFANPQSAFAENKQNTEKTLQSKTKVELAWSNMWRNIQNNYAYFEQKNIDSACISRQYTQRLNNIEKVNETSLFFEQFLFEFADDHMSLNTHSNDSYRLNSPIAIKENNRQFFVEDYWQNQFSDDSHSTKKLRIGAQLISINNKSPQQIINEFPTLCLDKSNPNNQQWIINKSLAGIYSQPRIVQFSYNNQIHTIDLDQFSFKPHHHSITLKQHDDIAVIKVNNSLGQTELINQYDQAIDELIKQKNTNKGLILDLRNTISGGDSYIARGLISRLIQTDQAYQKHLFIEQRDGGPKVPRYWMESVQPRLTHYGKPVVLLVNRWTGSMGEGLTIGLHGMNRAHVIGSPMAGLLGAVYSYSLDGLKFGYQMPTEQLFHIDGTPRENFLPDEVVKPTYKQKDAVMARALEWFGEK